METEQAYCIKCKSKQNILDAQDAAFKNGTPIRKGKCASCGGTLFRIMKRPKQTEVVE